MMSFLLAVSLIQAAALGEPAVPPIVLEVHDLRGLPRFEIGNGPALRILPSLGYATQGWKWGPQVDAGEYVNIFRALAGDELESEGRSIFETAGLMRMRAPTAVQELAAGTFEFLGGVFGADIELQFDSIVLPKGRASSSSVVPAEEADQLVATAETKLGSWRTRISSSRPASIVSARTIPLVADFNCEIAQSAIAYDPIVLIAEVGTRILAAAAPTPQGTWLALIVDSSDPLGDVRDLDVSLAGLVGTSIEEKPNSGQAKFLGATSPRSVAGPKKLQSLSVQDRSFVLNTFLPEGRAIVLTTGLNARTARGTRALVVRRGAAALPLHARFRPDEHGQNLFSSADANSSRPEIFAIDMSSARPPTAHVEDPNAIGLDPTLPESDGLIANISTGDLDGVLEEIGGAAEASLNASNDFEIRQVGTWAVFTGVHGLDEIGIGKRTSQDPLAVMERLRPTPRVFQVTLTLSRHGEMGARCTLPLRTGAPSTVVLAAEELVLAETDVEIAQSASVADPVTKIEMDGLIVHLEPRVARTGAVSLEISASARLSRGATREFASGSEFLPNLQLTSADQLRVFERLVFDAAAGVRAFRLGDRTEPSEGLALDVEMIEVR